MSNKSIEEIINMILVITGSIFLILITQCSIRQIDKPESFSDMVKSCETLYNNNMFYCCRNDASPNAKDKCEDKDISFSCQKSSDFELNNCLSKIDQIKEIKEDQ